MVLWASPFLGSLLTAAYRSDLHLTGVPPKVAEAAESSLAGAVAAGAAVLQQAQDAFITGLHVALFGGAITAIVTAIAVTILLRRRHDPAGTNHDAVPVDPVSQSLRSEEAPHDHPIRQPHGRG